MLPRRYSPSRLRLIFSSVVVCFLHTAASALGVRSGAVATPYREPFVCKSVSLFREPDAGNLPVRFDERGEETGLCQTGLRWWGESPSNRHREATVTAPLLDSTLSITL